MDGHVRAIDNIRLGYVLYLDRGTPEKVLAFPTWVMRCQYYKNAKQEASSQMEGKSQKDYVHTQDQIIFNAQTGEMVEVFTKNRDAVYCPQIITWDDVGGKP